MHTSEHLNRLQELNRKAERLREFARQKMNPSDDDGLLWMSSLDIIGEILNVVNELVDEQQRLLGQPGLTPHSGYAAHAQEYREELVMECPSCRSLVGVSYGCLEDAAATCPHCGETVLLANPT